MKKKIDKLRGLSLDYIRSRLDYDKTTGQLTWKDGRSAGNAVTSTTGRSGEGYVVVNFYLNGKHKTYLGHVLIFSMVTGRTDFGNIDHIDGNPRNNCWSNLREADQSLNCRNLAKRSDNKTGIAGVTWERKVSKWRAVGYYKGKQIHLLLTEDLFEAACARKSYELKNGYTERHGRE